MFFGAFFKICCCFKNVFCEWNVVFSEKKIKKDNILFYLETNLEHKSISQMNSTNIIVNGTGFQYIMEGKSLKRNLETEISMSERSIKCK